MDISSTIPVKLYEGTGIGASVYSANPPKNAIKKVNTESYKRSFNSSPVLYWGEDNLYPNHLFDASKKCGILLQGLNRLVEATINQGLFTYKILDQNADGNYIVKEVKDTNFEKFRKLNKLDQVYLPAVAADYWKYGMVVPIYKLEKTHSEITRLISYRTKDCRLEKRNPDTGNIENVYISAQWVNNRNLITTSEISEELQKWIFKIGLLDEWDTIEVMKARKKDFDFAQLIKHPMSEDDYGFQPWHSVYENKWLNIASSVPEMKEKLFMYAMTISYMIGINVKYFETVYGQKIWNGWDAKTRSEKVKEIQESIEKNLLGKENAFKSFFYSFATQQGGNLDKNMILEVVDNKIRDGISTIDNMQANAEIATALGVNPSLLGTSAMGEKSSTGSGSNIREAMLDLSSRIRLHRDKLLDPLNVIRDYNGWDENLMFGFKDYIINTQDGRQADTGKQVIIAP